MVGFNGVELNDVAFDVYPRIMSELELIAPTQRHRVIDLVQAAGVNVDDWANYANGKKDPGQNPKYCYDWAFVEPGKVVVLNLWFELMQEREGVIWQDLDLRQDAADYRKLPHKSVWAKRAKKMDEAIQTALNKSLPVRVVVCDGDMRGSTSEASHVARRLLDPMKWSVTSYSWETGRCTLTRAHRPERITAKTLEQSFQDKAIEVYELAKDLGGYNAIRFLQKIRRVGALKAAKDWLDPRQGSLPTSGFLKLFDADLLDISLEALVLRRPWNQLFTNEELTVAASRLRSYGYVGEETIYKRISVQDGDFKPKSDADYKAFICGGIQSRSRTHEKLVNAAAEYFSMQGFQISSPHPIDLLMLAPIKIIFEAKAAGRCGGGFAIRAAIGQLYEYQHFLGPPDAILCIVLDCEPDEFLVSFVEKLGLQIVWFNGITFLGGPKTQQVFSKAGIKLNR